jgi:hypothetical protein
MRTLLLSISLLISLCGYSQDWEWSFPTNNLEHVKTVIADNNEIYLAAEFVDSCMINATSFYSDSSSNVIIVKLSPSGNIIWNKIISGQVVKFINLAAEGNNLMIAMRFSKQISGAFTSFTPYHAFLLGRIAEDGNIISSFTSGQGKYSLIKDVSLLPDGEILVGGLVGDTITLGDNTFISETGGGYFAKFDNSYNLILYKDFIAPGPTMYFQLLRVGSDEAGNLYIEGDFGDSVKIASDTVIYFNFPFANLLKFNSQGILQSFHPSNTYFPHMTHFVPCNNGAYTIELWSDGTCNHCYEGLIIRRTAAGGTDDWIHSYEGSHAYSTPYFSRHPGGLAVTQNDIYFTARYGGDWTLGTYSFTTGGQLLVKMDHAGNYTRVDTIPNHIAADELSNFRNGSIIATGYNIYPGLIGTVSKYRDTLATGIPDLKSLSFLRIFPNPSDGIFKLESRNGNIISNVNVYDLAGKLVYSKQFNTSNSELDLSAFNDGFYFLTAAQNEETIRHKLVISRK